MSRKKNTFSKVIGHLKSSKISEAAPTNSTISVMVPDAGTLTRQEFKGMVPDQSTIDWAVNGSDGKDTSGLFDASGNSKLIGPPITEDSPDNSYILGPMAAMYYTYASPNVWTMIGYIRQADRRMVNLGDIDGKLSDWDGVSNFTSYGQLTLEQARWFRDTWKHDGSGDDPANANYRAFYPGPPSSTPDAFGRYLCTITGTAKAEKKDYETVAPLDMQAADNFSSIFARLNDIIKRHHKGQQDWLDNLPDQYPEFFDKGSEIGIQMLDTMEKIGEIGEAKGRYALNKFAQFMTYKGGGVVGLTMAAATDIRNYIKGFLPGNSETDRWMSTGIYPQGDTPPFNNTGSSATAYAVNMAMGLMQSMGTGRPVYIGNDNMDVNTVGGRYTKADIDKMLNAHGLYNNRPDVSMSADAVLNPKGKDVYGKDNKGFGSEGGSISQIYIDPDTGKIMIQDTADKFFRVGGESGEGIDWGTQTFSDIPIPPNIVKRLTQEVENGAVAKVVSALHGSDISEADAQKVTEELMENDNFRNAYNTVVTAGNSPMGDWIVGKSTGFVNGAAGGALLYGKAKQAFGLIKQSELDSKGGHGHVRRQNQVGLENMDPEVAKYLQEKVNEIRKRQTNLGPLANAQQDANKLLDKMEKGLENNMPPEEYEKLFQQWKKKIKQRDRNRPEGIPIDPKFMQQILGSRGNKSLTSSHYLQGLTLSESRKSILKNLKQPVVLPETKQKSYKVNPGKRNKTNFQGMDKLVGDIKPQSPFKTKRDVWSKDWQDYNAKQSQEKKNQVLEKIGDGKKAFNYMLTDSKKMNADQLEQFWGLHPEMHKYFYNGKEYKATRKEEVKGDLLLFMEDENGEKSTILQSELSIKLAEGKERQMLDEYNEIQSKKEPTPYLNDPLMKKVAKRLKNEIEYEGKPAVKGYPNEPPPEMVNGWHPRYGKTYKYDKLDPVSAVMMRKAPTGNPEIDANVEKAANKLKPNVKVKEEKVSNWRDEIEIKEETPKEEVKLFDRVKNIQEQMTSSNLFGIEFGAAGDRDLQGWIWSNWDTDDIPNGEGEFFNDIAAGEIDEYNYPGSAGWATMISANMGQTGTGDNGLFNLNDKQDYIHFFNAVENDGMEGNFLRTTPIDARSLDTISIEAIVGNNSNGGKSPGTSNNWGLYVYHWHDGLPVVDGASDWQFWSSNPTDYTIVPHNGAGTLTTYTLTIPESARVERLYLNFGWAAMDGADQSKYRSGDLGITRLGFQRRQPMNVIIGLDTPEGSAFVRSGTSLLKSGGKKIKKDLSKEERYESVLSMLNASKEYTDMILGIQFPGSNTLLWGNEIQGSDVEKYHEKERARQAKIAQARFEADPNQHGSAAWRAKQKEMYPTVNDQYADWADKLKGANGQPLFPEGYRVYSGRAGGRHSPNDSRAQILSRIHPPWVKFNRPTKTRTRGRTAADIKADFEAGKHIKHLPHRQKWLAARQAKAERDLARKRERQIAKDSKGRSSSRAVSKAIESGIDRSNYKEVAKEIVPNASRSDQRQFEKNAKEVSNLSADKKAEFERRIAELDKDIAKFSKQEQDARKEMKRIAVQFGIDVALTIAGPLVISKALQGIGIGWKAIRAAKVAKASNVLKGSSTAQKFVKGASKVVDDGDELLDIVTKGTNYPTVKTSPEFDQLTNVLKSDRMSKILLQAREKGSKVINFKFKGKTYRFNVDKLSDFGVGNLKLSYEPEGPMIQETTFEKLKQVRLKFNYKGKPTPTEDGFPEEPPATPGPDGFHPKYGKHAARYKRLDPASADSMPATGDPETDALVDKQKSKQKRFSDFTKNPTQNWSTITPQEVKTSTKKSEGKLLSVKEAMTTSSVFSQSLASAGDADLVVFQTGITGNGDIDFGEPGSEDNVMAGDGEYTALTAFDDTLNVNDPLDQGKRVRTPGTNYHNGDGYSHGWVGQIPGSESGGIRGAKPRGDYNDSERSRRVNQGLPLLQGGASGYWAKYGTSIDQLGLDSGSWNSTDGTTDVGYGTNLVFDGAGSPRYAALKAIDSTEFDTIKIHADVGGSSMTGAGKQLRVFYWAGDKPGFFPLEGEIPASGGKNHAGWIPIYQKPSGEIDTSVDANIIPNSRPAANNGVLAAYSVKIPEWCRGKNTRFMLFQQHSGSDTWSLSSIRFQRRNPITSVAPLDDPVGNSFMRVGQQPHEFTSPEERKKKIEEMLRASREYLLKQLGFDDFPGMSASLASNPASPINFDDVYKNYRDTLSKEDKKSFQKERQVRDRKIKQGNISGKSGPPVGNEAQVGDTTKKGDTHIMSPYRTLGQQYAAKVKGRIGRTR